MNTQFATQFLREEEGLDWLEDYMKSIGADETLIEYTLMLIDAGLIEPERAIEIMKQTLGLTENGLGGGGSTTGGGVTNGATFTPGTGEQYAAGTRKVRKEDAPMLAHGKADISTYTKDGFKPTSAKQQAKNIKGVEVKDLWEADLNESRAYTQFKKETTLRPKSEQLHQAAKMIRHKLEEVEKLLEFTSKMRQELSEGEEVVEYTNNTKKIFEKIHKKVVEVYTKVKGLK